MIGSFALYTGRIAGHGTFFQLVVLALVGHHIPGFSSFNNALPAIFGLVKYLRGHFTV
jgi:hypothetical protein